MIQQKNQNHRGVNILKATLKKEARVPLNRSRALQVAVTLADQGGVEALSMRKLAQELGVEAMSL